MSCSIRRNMHFKNVCSYLPTRKGMHISIINMHMRAQFHITLAYLENATALFIFLTTSSFFHFKAMANQFKS